MGSFTSGTQVSCNFLTPVCLISFSSSFRSETGSSTYCHSASLSGHGNKGLCCSNISTILHWQKTANKIFCGNCWCKIKFSFSTLISLLCRQLCVFSGIYEIQWLNTLLERWLYMLLDWKWEASLIIRPGKEHFCPLLPLIMSLNYKDFSPWFLASVLFLFGDVRNPLCKYMIQDLTPEMLILIHCLHFWNNLVECLGWKNNLSCFFSISVLGFFLVLPCQALIIFSSHSLNVIAN